MNQQPQPGLLRPREAEGRGKEREGKGKRLPAASYGPSQSGQAGRARRRGGTHRRGAERSRVGAWPWRGEGFRRGVQATHPAAARPCQRSGE